MKTATKVAAAALSLALLGVWLAVYQGALSSLRAAPAPSEAGDDARFSISKTSNAAPVKMQRDATASSGEHDGDFSTYVHEADDDRATSFKCSMFGDHTDVCVYENVCFRGSGGLGLLSATKAGKVPSSMLPGTHIRFTTKQLTKGAQLVPRVRPAQFKLTDARYVPLKMFDEWEAAGKVLWANKTMHVPSVQERLTNIWYFAAHTLPVYSSQFYRSRFDLPPITPKDSVVVFPNGASKEKLTPDWHQRMLDLIVPSTTDRFYDTEAPYHGLKLERTPYEAICAKKAVLYGVTQYGFPDWMTAEAFRLRAYASVNVTMPDAPPLKVTILDRRSYLPRHMTNAEEVRQLVRKYGIEPRYVVWDHATFQEQVETLADTGVFLTIHGAGLVNQIFLPRGAAVIEIFPMHVKHVLYERMAHYLDLYHFKVYATKFAKGFEEKYPKYFEHGCHNMTTLTVPEYKDCWLLMKNPAVEVPIDDLEVALANALDFVSPVPVFLKRPAA